MGIEYIIKSMRTELDVTQEQLAHDLDISYTTLNRWENGHNVPSRLVQKEIARYCAEKGISAELIIELEHA